MSFESIDSTDSHWYAIHTNPRQEERTESNLKAWNVETFAPRIREQRRNSFTGVVQFLIKPLFPRYIFARFNLERSFHNVRYTRGVNSLVGVNGCPAQIDDEIIAIIKSRIGKHGVVRIGVDLKPGDMIIVKDGPLKDFTGLFEREMNDSDRVLVLLNTINYQGRVQIDRASLQKLSRSA